MSKLSVRRAGALALLAVAINGLSACSTQPSAGGEAAAPLYALSSLVFGDEASMTYVSLLSSLDENVDFDQAREFAGSADIWWHEGALFVSDGESKTITKFTVQDRALVEGDTISFADFGPGDFGFWVNAFVAPDKAYLLIGGGTEYVVWNPQDMTLRQTTIELPALPDQGALKAFNSYSDRASVQRGSLLYQPFYYTDEAFFQFAPFTSIVVTNTETDEVVEVLEAPCPGLDFATQDDDGNAYFSSWVFAPGGAAVLEQPTTCVVKLEPGTSSTFSKLFDVPDVTDGRQGGVMRYLGDGKALLSVLHDDNTTSTDPDVVTFGSNWRFWLYDLAAGTARQLPDVAWNAGAAYASVVGAKPQMLVPAGDYLSTKLYTFETDGSATPRLERDGWALRLFDLGAQP